MRNLMETKTAAACLVGLLAGLLFSLDGASAAPQTEVGRVTKVVLYRGQAMITREIDLQVKKGSLEVVVGDLPEQIVPDSLFAEGGDQIEVRAVRFRTRAVGQQPREEVRKLDEEILEVSDRIELNSKQQELLAKRSAYLDSLEGFVAPTAKLELSQGVLDAEVLERITTFAFAQRAEIVERQVELTQQSRELTEELALLQRKRNELTGGAARTEREAVLFLEIHAVGDQTVRLNYLVSNCGWSPTYTFRAENGEPVQVECNALISQLSGENWDHVDLTLSTASPALSSTGPGLAPFVVSLANLDSAPPAATGEADLLNRLKQIQSAQQMAIQLYRNTTNCTFRENVSVSIRTDIRQKRLFHHAVFAKTKA